MAGELIPFRVDVPDADLDDLRERLRRTRWPERETVDDWSQGVPLGYLQDLCRHWERDYGWRRVEARVNELPAFRTEIDGLHLHAVHVPSPEANAVPLVLTHGWPGSYLEFLDVIGPLSDPVAHGGSADDAFHVVVPSLPGYAWSDRPTRTGWGIEHIADAWVELMARLGYDRFAAQGGDWGAAVTTRLAQHHPDRMVGVHLNMVRPVPPKDGRTPTPAEQHTIERGHHYRRWDSGYSTQQASRPQTLGYALVDSPVGQCAWILEKLCAWSDCDGDPVAAFGADRVLDAITLYWLTATGASSGRLYWESFHTPRTGTIDVPAAVSAFPREIVPVPRSWAEPGFTDLRYWGEPERGGHFAAFEQPAIFVEEVRSAFRLMR
jgi:pimeloyl-ACP methyl ester carboxylesterase